jgi:hypothetical protein
LESEKIQVHKNVVKKKNPKRKKKQTTLTAYDMLGRVVIKYRKPPTTLRYSIASSDVRGVPSKAITFQQQT